MPDLEVADSHEIETGAAEIAASLFGEPEKEVPDIQDETEVTDAPVSEVKPEVETEVQVDLIPPPKSWAKEKHELWGKLPKDAQEYYQLREKQMLDGLDQYKEHSSFGKQMRDIMTPYRPIIQAAGIDETQAVQTLLNAHYRLTQGSQEQRHAAYQELGRSLGFVEPPTGGTPVDPNVKMLQDQINRLESGLTAREQAQLTDAKARVAAEVEAFASDPSHPYFDEVADDIVAMIQTGASLKDAYEKAVWANPITRQKEIARLNTEQEKSLKEKAKVEAEKARKAKSSNVRTHDTSKSPTEKKGKLFGTEHDQEMDDIIQKAMDSTH